MIDLLELGCGKDKLKGSVGLDHYPYPGVDIVADVTKGIPLADNSVARIYSKYMFEHVNGIQFVMEECYRVLKPGGRLEVLVPHATNVGSFVLLNYNFFMYDAFSFFILGEGDGRTTAKFRYVDRRIVFGKMAFWNYVIEPLVNLMPRVYENTPLRVFPARDLHVTLQAVKERVLK